MARDNGDRYFVLEGENVSITLKPFRPNGRA